jgi:hypothetical protein
MALRLRLQVREVRAATQDEVEAGSLGADVPLLAPPAPAQRH